MANIHFDQERVLSAMDAIVRRTMNMDMMWDWPCGVAYLGICEAYRVTQKQEYLELLRNRVDEYIGLGLPADVPSLGKLITEGRKLLASPSKRYQLIYPTLVLSFITVSFYIIGNAFSDASDPRNHI